MEIIAWEIFLLGAGNLIKSGFEHFELFSKLKGKFYKHWTSIKIKVVWPVCVRRMKLKYNGTGAKTLVRNEVSIRL